MVIGWVLILVADSVLYLYVSRLMCGFAAGFILFSVVPMYLGEIASDKIRGSILSISSIFIKSGNVFTFAIAPFVSIYAMAWFLLIPPLLFYVAFFWCPESPYYLLGKGKRDEALKSLARLRSRSNVEEELQIIEEAVKQSNANRGSYKDLLSPDHRRGLIIMLLLGFGSQACGIEPMVLYSEVIFSQIGNDFIEPGYINIVFAIAFVLGTIVANLLIDRVGRRKLMLFSVFVLAVCHTINTVFFNYQKNGFDVQFISWLPIVSMLLLIFGAGSGIATLLVSLIGEIFAKHMKAYAVVLLTIVTSGSSFGFSKLFQYMSENFGYDSIFGIFAGFGFLFIPIFWWIIPETNGKPLGEILVELKSNLKKNIKG